MATANDVVFLLDVDNTLLDNDGVQDDLRNHLEREFGAIERIGDLVNADSAVLLESCGGGSAGLDPYVEN